jgi:glycosyltransferase involved in cell wall biosynthesis
MLGWELPPHNSGGLGVACFHICKALASKGADINFIVPYTADHSDIKFMQVTSAVPASAKQVMKAGMAYESFKFVDHEGNEEWVSLQDYHKLYERSIDGIVKLAEYDVIHAHDWLTIRAGIRAKQLTGKPLIVHIHATEYDRSGGKRGNPVVEDIEYLGMMLADKIIAVSQLTKDVIVQHYGIPADKIDVIHNSFDIDMYDGVQGENDYRYLSALREHGYKVVMNVGRITVQKGLYNLVQTMRLVVDKRPKTILLFVGSGEQELELLELAAELGLSGNVIFAGFQRGKRWRDMFAVSDIFVMPSISEPFGLTALEAAAFGVSTLVSRQSGVAEVLRSALRVDYWDVHEMANQITAVLNNQDLQDQLIHDGYHEVEKMTWGHTAEKLLGVYRIHAAGALA